MMKENRDLHQGSGRIQVKLCGTPVPSDHSAWCTTLLGGGTKGADKGYKKMVWSRVIHFPDRDLEATDPHLPGLFD